MGTGKNSRGCDQGHGMLTFLELNRVLKWTIKSISYGVILETGLKTPEAE